MNDERAPTRLRDACAHDEAADRHMKAAVLWRDLGQIQRAVLEVKFAMVERHHAQLERERATLETLRDQAPAGRSEAVREVERRRAAEPRDRAVTTKGAVEVVYGVDGWHVLWDGEPESDSVHPFRLEAVVVAHDRAQRARCELVIRGWSGATREHVSYRDDPIDQRVLYRPPELRRA